MNNHWTVYHREGDTFVSECTCGWTDTAENPIDAVALSKAHKANPGDKGESVTPAAPPEGGHMISAGSLFGCYVCKAEIDAFIQANPRTNVPLRDIRAAHFSAIGQDDPYAEWYAEQEYDDAEYPEDDDRDSATRQE